MVKTINLKGKNRIKKSEKNAETRMIVEELFEKKSIVEVGDVASELGIALRATRDRLKDAGIKHKRGFVMNPNGSNGSA